MSPVVTGLRSLGTIGVAAGFNHGAWNGMDTVITSMSAATAARARTTLAVATAASVMGTNPSDDVVYMGETLSGNDAIVKYTYVGDFNLDGKVNGDDYFRIDNGYGAHATGYDAGDSDFSGSVNADDYFGIDRNYGAQGPPL